MNNFKVFRHFWPTLFRNYKIFQTCSKKSWYLSVLLINNKITIKQANVQNISMIFIKCLFYFPFMLTYHISSSFLLSLIVHVRLLKAHSVNFISPKVIKALWGFSQLPSYYVFCSLNWFIVLCMKGVNVYFNSFIKRPNIVRWRSFENCLDIEKLVQIK